MSPSKPSVSASVPNRHAASEPSGSDAQLRAMLRVGRPPLGGAARRLIAIRLDPDVLNRFRKEAKRRKVGYQTLINQVLAEYVQKHVA